MSLGGVVAPEFGVAGTPFMRFRDAWSVLQKATEKYQRLNAGDCRNQFNRLIQFWKPKVRNLSSFCGAIRFDAS